MYFNQAVNVYQSNYLNYANYQHLLNESDHAPLPSRARARAFH
jgi:hypothetical protein